jgi:hypothetical protein
MIARIGRSLVAKSILLILILGLAPFSVASADSLGRLFFTPQERAHLNRVRNGTPLETQPAIVTVPSRLDGFVERSSGKNTVWINGRPSSEVSSDINPQLVHIPVKIVIQPTANSGKRAR